MSESKPSRRDFGRVAAASALAGVALPAVHAGENNTIQLALIGCGGRGTGAIADALGTRGGPIKLVAMADVFENRLTGSYQRLHTQFGDRIDVPAERRFVGFDAYRRAMDCLRAGDVAVLATPGAFRVTHLGYAVQKGLNAFLEKSLAVDGPNMRRLLDLADQSTQRNLKVAVGLMCRHCQARKELYQRIKDGQIGDLVTLRAYRMHGPAASVGPKPASMSDLLFQVQRFHGFFWAGGGFYVDWLIHNIDECCWMKDAWPVKAQGSGGRMYRGEMVDQNFDHYSVEYTFADGSKLFVCGRGMPGCHQEFASYAHGTRGSAVISSAAHSPTRCRISRGQDPTAPDPVWRFPGTEPNPYQLEWDHFIEAIRQNRPYNEVRRGAEANLVALMGRHAVHTGKVVTWDEMLQHRQEFAPGIADLTLTSAAPLSAGSDGKYPLPQPGQMTDREY